MPSHERDETDVVVLKQSSVRSGVDARSDDDDHEVVPASTLLHFVRRNSHTILYISDGETALRGSRTFSHTFPSVSFGAAYASPPSGPLTTSPTGLPLPRRSLTSSKTAAHSVFFVDAISDAADASLDASRSLA